LRLDEAGVVLRARRLSRDLTIEQIQQPLQAFVEAVTALPSGIVLRFDESLTESEAGHTLVVAGKRFIVLNGNDSPGRQRFTAGHEIAHIVLDLPTEHDDGGSEFARRSPNEVFCDLFAAELILPRHLLQPRIEDSDFGFTGIEDLANTFVASLAATGTRFAELCDRPCAVILMKDGFVRYAKRSKTFQETGAWIQPGGKAPSESFAARLMRSEQIDGPIEVDATAWLEDWKHGGRVMEDARHFPRWNQTLSLIWFERDRIPSSENDYSDDEDDEPALRPLDGVLPWPGKSRRRR
jgi:Zn-dependent peptidase ImmA (M78 family)